MKVRGDGSEQKVSERALNCYRREKEFADIGQSWIKHDNTTPHQDRIG